jgi:hypothetical protein
MSPASPPYVTVSGGVGGAHTTVVTEDAGLGGGAGGAGGDGEDAPGWDHCSGGGGCGGVGSGGGGGGSDGSVTLGDSNAGHGGRGGDGTVLVSYPALTAPLTPAAPSVVAGNGSATLSITPLADIPDYYMLWVAGEPDKSCTVTPPETSCVIEGLTNGESYTFLTAAGNAAGYSAESAESLAVTPDINAGMLPYTGNNSRGLVSLALTMIGLGGAVTALARRRRTITITIN